MKLKTFPGGVHPPDQKEWSAHKPIEECPLPEEMVVPLSQHIGAPAEVAVCVGDRVMRGQEIGRGKGFVSVPVHAPTSGEVLAIEPRPHPSGRHLPAVVLRSDGEDLWDESIEGADPDHLDAEQLRDLIRKAGVVGLGGAAFPTHVKLTPPPEKHIDTLVLNGVECEPYLTADHRLMVEEPDRVLDGLAILAKVLGVQRIMVGIEANKPDALKRMAEKAAGRNAEVVPLEVKYPQGAEKQLILALTGREVPSGGLPMDVGVVVQNVGTVAAVSDAVRRGIPLIERIATITGPGIVAPKNLRFRIGTPLSHLVACCDGLQGEPAKIIMGGPMMGTAQLSLDVPAIKGTSGLLLFRQGDIVLGEAGPCIRCGRCVQACPARLMPTTIAAYARLEMVNEAEDFNAMDCIECGCCAFICPARIPLVQAIRYAKAAILAKRRSI